MIIFRHGATACPSGHRNYRSHRDRQDKKYSAKAKEVRNDPECFLIKTTWTYVDNQPQHQPDPILFAGIDFQGQPASVLVIAHTAAIAKRLIGDAAEAVQLELQLMRNNIKRRKTIAVMTLAPLVIARPD